MTNTIAMLELFNLFRTIMRESASLPLSRRNRISFAAISAMHPYMQAMVKNNAKRASQKMKE
jgi:hypothetical protein